MHNISFDLQTCLCVFCQLLSFLFSFLHFKYVYINLQYEANQAVQQNEHILLISAEEITLTVFCWAEMSISLPSRECTEFWKLFSSLFHYECDLNNTGFPLCILVFCDLCTIQCPNCCWTWQNTVSRWNRWSNFAILEL